MIKACSGRIAPPGHWGTSFLMPPFKPRAAVALSPHVAHLRLHIDRRSRRALSTRRALALRPVPALEVPCDAVRNKARALRVDMPVAEAALPVREEALRHHQVQLVPRPRH